MTETAAGLDIFNQLASTETKPDVNYFFANGAKLFCVLNQALAWSTETFVLF